MAGRGGGAMRGRGGRGMRRRWTEPRWSCNIMFWSPLWVRLFLPVRAVLLCRTAHVMWVYGHALIIVCFWLGSSSSLFVSEIHQAFIIVAFLLWYSSRETWAFGYNLFGPDFSLKLAEKRNVVREKILFQLKKKAEQAGYGVSWNCLSMITSASVSLCTTK